MSRTILAILIAAGLCIVFVLFKYLGVSKVDFGGIKSASEASLENASEFSSWVTFNPDTKKFTASFPSKPQHISQNSPDSFNRFIKHYEIYGSEGLDKSGFMIQAITYSNGKDPAEDKAILDNTLADFLATSSINRLQSSEKTTFHGENALKFEIDSGEKRISGLIFVENKTLFVLSRIIPLQDKDETEDFEHFIQSFKVNNSSDSTPKPAATSQNTKG